MSSSASRAGICPGCRRPLLQCVCHPGAAPAPVRVSRQTQGRAGKGVSVISGLPLGTAEIEQLARELKRRCGSGGTVREGVIEIQGDHRDLLVAELVRRGFAAKRAGG